MNDLNQYFSKNLYQDTHISPQELNWVNKFNMNLNNAKHELKYQLPTSIAVLKLLKQQPQTNLGEKYVSIKYSQNIVADATPERVKDLEKYVRTIKSQFNCTSPLQQISMISGKSIKQSESPILQKQKKTQRMVSLSVLGKKEPQ